jgi:glutamine synthetase
MGCGNIFLLFSWLYTSLFLYLRKKKYKNIVMTTRFSALNKFSKRNVPEKVRFNNKVSEYFGQNVFSMEKMQEYLTKETFGEIKKSMNDGKPIGRRYADQVAEAMKVWALSKGATHYTHWFQPLTGETAEKHDSFLTLENGKAIESFAGKNLAQQEPDASSLPNGGIRDTFEARGYTAWDPSSPAFVFGTTLCIPTIFISYTGESLDHKTPLLKSINTLNDAATKICQYFDKNVSRVSISLGAEQEYFLIDRALYLARPDLVQTNRTLMGHQAAKDQQLDDHYFGAIPERVALFMEDVQHEAYKLGIPLTTRHNEVAPNQFEVAPFFEELNLANDHNMLLFEVMESVARRHDFKVLFHEKPFNNINGSGKHCNWSVVTDTGVNVFSPGKNPKSNMQFLTFLICTLKAVHKHQDLLRASILTGRNKHRLGGAEAPPLIMSTFLGSTLSKTLDNLEKEITGDKMTPQEKTRMKLDVSRIPEILLDSTDRNRTSPFAFTGNRFEFRAVGSSQNCAGPMTIVNAILAEQLIDFKKQVDENIEAGLTKDEAIFKIIQKFIVESKDIRFEGNGYGEEWVKEAAKRGLTNVNSICEAAKTLISKEAVETFSTMNVLNEKEAHARYEIELEKYFLHTQIESRVLGDLAINHIIPVAYEYQNRLIENVEGLKNVLGAESDDFVVSQIETIKNISKHIQAIYADTHQMIEERKVANKFDNIIEKAKLYEEKVSPYIESIRKHIDKLELIVDDKLWPLPKYRELLFSK